MGGPDTIKGIGYQNAYTLYRLLELLNEGEQTQTVTVEGRGENVEDLTITYADGSEEIVQVKKRETSEGPFGLWQLGDVKPIVAALYRLSESKRNIVAFRFVATGSAHSRIIAIQKACQRLREGGFAPDRDGRAVSDVSAMIGAGEERARDFMRRLWLNVPMESEAHFELAVQNRLMRDCGVPPDTVGRVYNDLYKRVLDKGKQNEPEDRVIPREELLGWLVVGMSKQRAAVWNRMRHAVLSDRMAEVRTEDELEAFLREQDKQKLIRDEEYEDLKYAFAEVQGDHELQHRYIQHKIEVEWQKEMDRIALLGETELLELRLMRRNMELQALLNEERIQAIERKRTEIEVRQRELEMALQKAKTQAEITAIQREQDRLDGELGIHLLGLMDARKIKKQREEMLLEAEQEERVLERRLREERARHEAEMERLQLLSQASVELLISVSGAEQAGLLADLKRTETLAGMTEEQILALAAERSPKVARAFQEKFRAFSAEQQAEMYERMLKDRETAAAQLT